MYRQVLFRWLRASVFALLALWIGFASAATFDESKRAPNALSGIELKKKADLYFTQMGEGRWLDIVKDRSMYTDWVIFRSQIGAAIDRRVPLTCAFGKRA